MCGEDHTQPLPLVVEGPAARGVSSELPHTAPPYSNYGQITEMRSSATRASQATNGYGEPSLTELVSFYLACWRGWRSTRKRSRPIGRGGGEKEMEHLFDDVAVIGVPAQAEEYNRKSHGHQDNQGDHCGSQS